jgi:hypothetical protein
MSLAEPIPVDESDRRELSAMVWPLPHRRLSQRRLCHLRNLAARGLAERRADAWAMTPAGWRVLEG